MHWFDNTGIEHGAPGIGSWDDDLVFHHELHLGLTRYIYSVEDSQLRLRIDNSAEGHEWTTFLEGRYTRS
jgi:hypothetical protein